MSMLALSLTLFTLSAPAENPNPWELKRDKKGLKVWARDVPGSKIREVKAEKTLSVKADRVWEVLGDVEHYIEFMPYIEETKMLGKFGEGHYEYQRLHPPIVSRRDYAVKVLLSKDADGTMWRRWSPANEKAPPLQENVVRVQVNRGHWKITPKGNSAIVEYYLYTAPGGSIPAWIANKANTTSIPDMFKAVEQRGLNPGWKR